MKRILWLMAALLLLCGCTTQHPEETHTDPPQTMPPQTEVTEPAAGIYEAFSDLEIRTEGAVRYYLPDMPDVCGMKLLNGDVLIFSGTDCTTLTRYAGDTLVPVGRITLDCRILPEDSSLQVSEHGITYYDAAANAVVYLDNDLDEVSRLALPEDLVGKPVLSSDRTHVFYCSTDGVRVYDTASGLDKLLKSISYPAQTVEDVLMEDSILRCSFTDEQNQSHTLFLSSRDGQWIAQTDEELELICGDNRWIARRDEGILKQVIFGGAEGAVQALYPEDVLAESWILAENYSVITASTEGQTTRLDCYDLESGSRTAYVELPGIREPWYVESASGSEAVYVLAYDEMAGCPVILRWDLTVQALLDDLTYTGPRYTAEKPDEAGLEECRTLARIMGEKYGVSILLGPEAAQVQPVDYVLEQEYQVKLILRQLTALEEALSSFPEGFFGKLPGQTNICVLRSITGNAQTGSVARAQGIQFWEGDRAYIALEAGESLYQAFFHEIFHVIDSKVLSTTRVYYRWDNLNPEEFDYFEDFTSYLTADVGRYLEPETRAFIDAYSMCYPREDRARIMEYACTEGNEAYFTSEIMQNKLQTLCEGIRKAFGLEKYQEPLIWEQYLAEPLNSK